MASFFSLATRSSTLSTTTPALRAGGSSNFYLQASRIDPASNRMKDVAIYDVSNPEKSRTVYADSAQVATNAAKTDLVLTLFDGHVREVDTAPLKGVFDRPWIGSKNSASRRACA